MAHHARRNEVLAEKLTHIRGRHIQAALRDRQLDDLERELLHAIDEVIQFNAATCQIAALSDYLDRWDGNLTPYGARKFEAVGLDVAPHAMQPANVIRLPQRDDANAG